MTKDQARKLYRIMKDFFAKEKIQGVDDIFVSMTFRSMHINKIVYDDDRSVVKRTFGGLDEL